MTVAYIGIGSNAGDARAHVLQALQELAQLPETRLEARSALYRSAPVDAPGQADYVNAAAGLDTELSAAQLLGALQDLEGRHGRERPYPNAPRTLDLDLLLYGTQSIDGPALRVPHPRLQQRAFVLRPLLDIDPTLTAPGLGSLAGWLDATREQRLQRIEDS